MSAENSPERYAALTDFYRARGYDQRLGMGSHPAIVVIDFSVAFTASAAQFPGGSFDAELAATGRVLDAGRGFCPIIFTTIAYQADLRDAGLWGVKVPWLSCCVLDSDAVAIDPRLAVQGDDLVLVKKYPSALYQTDLASRLNEAGVDTIIICGCTTSVCVRATALDAMQRGYRPMVVREAVGDFLPELHEIHLLDVGSRYADVCSVEEICRYLEVCGEGR